MTWIIEDVSGMIENSLGINHLTSLEVLNLKCKPFIANEFLDLLCRYDLPEQGLDKLLFRKFKPVCEPIEEEVLNRLASMCPHLSNFQMSHMDDLTESGRI